MWMTTFLDLHTPGTPLLMPNPWDAGSAKLLAALGFQALATTSGGFAATLGRLDGGVTRDEALAHAGAIVAAAADAAHRGPVHLVLTARAENYLHGHADLADTIARLQRYQEVGADVLF